MNIANVPVINAGKKRAFTEVIAWTQEWTVPEGVNSIDVRIFGAGAAGSSLPNRQCGDGGGGGNMAHDTFTVVPGTKYTVTIGKGGHPHISGQGQSGGASSFGTLLSASGGAGLSGGTGAGTGGDTSDRVTAGSGSYGGGGGSCGYIASYSTSRSIGGTGGTYGGGGGSARGTTVVSGGTYGGRGGRIDAYPLDGTNTMSIAGVEFPGTGAAGTNYCGGGGGYGGVGGNSGGSVYDKTSQDGRTGNLNGSGGGGGYGGKGGNGGKGYQTSDLQTSLYGGGGGGGGYGADGGNGSDAYYRDAYTYIHGSGGGGGGYGPSGKGGDGYTAGAINSVNQSSQIVYIGNNGGVAAGGGGTSCYWTGSVYGGRGMLGGNGGDGICLITYTV